MARFSREVSVRRLTGPEVHSFAATPEERIALAEAIDVLAIHELTAEATLSPWRSTGVTVAGTVRGVVDQACVVTLDPVRAEIEAPFAMRYHPEAAPTPVDVDPEADDPPEPLESERVDVGALALEHFVLSLDPYPRSPNAAFTPPELPEDDTPSPFAILARLKNGPE